MAVTAVIPCHNGGPYLAEALASVRAQSRPVDEVIVVDDASTDGSSEVAAAFGATVIRHEECRGEGASRNTGWRSARTPLVAWLDADDHWLEHHIELVAALAEQHDVAAAFGAVQQFGERHELLLGYVPEEPVMMLRQAFRTWLHPTIAAVLRRSALEAVNGLDEGSTSSVDFDLWLRLARSHRFVATRTVTAEWRMHPAQQSSDSGKQLKAVYAYRNRLLRSLEQEGDLETLRQLTADYPQVWRQDMRRALRYRDRAAAEAVLEEGRRVPGVTRPVRLSWRARAFALSLPAPSRSPDPNR
jgi:glycosyltransferase involved in cell wall biosynthesis